MMRLFAVLTLLLLAAAAASAHETRPAYLEIDQTAATTYRVLWKQPATGEVAIHLVPHLSNGWLGHPPSQEYATDGFFVRVWIVNDAAADPVDGCKITIDGLSNTITDVFVRVLLLNGQRLDSIIRPEAPSTTVALRDGNTMAWSQFVILGIEHILTGPDHLLFIFGLLLIVANRWMLLKTVSAFTVAHSLTLAAAALGKISLPPPLIDSLIALSILFLAPEALRAQRGETSLAIRYPWIVAFCFGLLHGLGFASGLTSLGLEKSALASALVSFNCGVEIGQLAFIAVVLGLQHALRLTGLRWPRAVAMAPSYLIGILGATWVIQCSAAVFTAGAQ